jgi:hypothetical protein
VGDNGQSTTFSDFTLRVMSVPVNLPDVAQAPPPPPPVFDVTAGRSTITVSRTEPAFIRMPETQQLSVDNTDSVVSTLSQTREVSLRLARPMQDQEVKSADSVKFTVPQGTFVHSDSSATITLYAQRIDGRPLPSWLRFNPATGQFEGTPPEDFEGDIDVKVIARDGAGHEAETVFRFHVQKRVGEKAAFKGKPSLSRSLQPRVPAAAGAR